MSKKFLYISNDNVALFLKKGRVVYDAENGKSCAPITFDTGHVCGRKCVHVGHMQNGDEIHVDRDGHMLIFGQDGKTSALVLFADDNSHTENSVF
jgi:hypothetical protein